eukprot:13256144-Alexandrium_andersonii.AAC.1
MASMLPWPCSQCGGHPCLCHHLNARLTANPETLYGVARPPPPAPWDTTGHRIPQPLAPATSTQTQSAPPEPWV